jgi:predicted nucleic acid-binding protein
VIVVDASAALEVLLRTPAGPRIETRLFAPGESLHVPHLLDLEVVHVLRRYEAARVIDAQRGQEAIADLTAWPLTRYPHDLFLARIWALRHNLTAYDAVYVALAETLNVTLVTCDERLVVSVGHRATIALV